MTAGTSGPLPGLLTLPGQVPLEPSREQARGWAVEELAGREYAAARPGIVERMLLWLLEQLQKVRVPDDPISVVALAVTLAVVLGVIGWAVHRAGGLRRSARRTGPAVLERPGTTSAEHRAAADRHAAAGEWENAVLERFRAIARGLEEDGTLLPRPGRTADEVARDAGHLLPDLATDLRDGAHLFDGVRYGGRLADAAAEGRLRHLGERVRGVRVSSA